MKRRGIFFKVFTYTTIFLILIVCVTVGLFSQQFLSFYSSSQIRQLNFYYQGLYNQLQGKTVDEAIETAEQFYANNQSFSFYIADNEDTIIFSTPNIDPNIIPDLNNFRIIMTVDRQYTLCATNKGMAKTDYGSLIFKSLLALFCMLAIGIIGTFVFARQITKPIKQLADATKKMANCEDVPFSPERSDEVGDLARDVYAMYDKLKDEILREKEMEETQRDFFSAASHELKTPIAATGVLLEGMLENVGDYKNHSKYLRECIKLTDAQSRMISEILEIVKLNDGKILPAPEKIELERMVADLLPDFQTLAKASGQRIISNINEGETIFADPKMIKKVLSNVILNAIQNTPKGGEIRIWTESAATDRGGRLCILNTGAKIDDTVLLRLFEPFYRMDKARSRKDGRSGLGLTIVQKALEAMKIDYSLENSPDGVLFWFDLPKN